MITDEIKEEKQTPERKRERPEENDGLHSLTHRKYSFPAGHTSHSALHACSTSTWKEAEAAEQERGSHISAGVLNTTDQNSQTEHGEATRHRNALGNSVRSAATILSPTMQLTAQKVSQFGFYRWNKLYWAATCIIKHWSISVISAVFLQNHFESLLTLKLHSVTFFLFFFFQLLICIRNQQQVL